jgi:hypothetical protein
MRHILTIEYGYSRVYVHSLALQAVVERCTNNSPIMTDGEKGPIPLPQLKKWMANDYQFINEVIDAARMVLRTVVEDLYPGNHLKHCPVRTFFRIVSVAMMLLKVSTSSSSQLHLPLQRV